MRARTASPVDGCWVDRRLVTNWDYDRFFHDIRHVTPGRTASESRGLSGDLAGDVCARLVRFNETAAPGRFEQSV